MAMMYDDKSDRTILVSANMYLYIEDDGFGNFYVYDKYNRGFLLNGTTSKDLLKYLYSMDQVDLVNEILNTLSTILTSEVNN